MANKNHANLLLQAGVRKWNHWIAKAKSEDTHLIPDLSGLDLSEINLSWANLAGVNLSQTNLSNADLRFTVLSNTNLSRANLSDANLSDINLSKSNLSGAILNGANLSNTKLSYTYLIGAHLLNTDLSGTDLFDTNFSNAIVGFTNFSNTDLSRAIGLETIKHLFPSTIGVNTILKSQGKIPDVFLKEIGTSYEIIKQVKSFVKKPWWNYSCYISYSSDDQEIAHHLCIDLQRSGVHCWLGAEDLKIKYGIHLNLSETLDINDRVLLIISESSIMSSWIENVVDEVIEKETQLFDEMDSKQLLFPIDIDNSTIETSKAWIDKICRTRHINSFNNWKDYYSYKEAFQYLLCSLR